MLSLRELEDEAKSLYKVAEGCDDDDTNALKDLFESLSSDICRKLDTTNEVIKKLELDVQLCEDNIRYSQQKKKSFNNKIEFLRELMKDVIVASGTTKFKSNATYTLSHKINFNFDDVLLFGLDREFIRVKEELDKTKMTEFIKAGGAIDGAILEDKTILTIRK
jgi:hypothetical protein